MKRFVLFAFPLFLLFVLLQGPVFAGDLQYGEYGGVRSRLEEMRMKREGVRETKRDISAQVKTKAEIASGAARLREKTVEGIKIAFGNILDRFDAALVRLDKIANRIATRIDKLNSEGVDTTAAQAALLTAEAAGANAKQAIDEAKSDVAAIDSSTATVKDAVHAAAGSIRSAKTALQGYHKALVGVLRELKAEHSRKGGE